MSNIYFLIGLLQIGNGGTSGKSIQVHGMLKNQRSIVGGNHTVLTDIAQKNAGARQEEWSVVHRTRINADAITGAGEVLIRTLVHVRSTLIAPVVVDGIDGVGRRVVQSV